VLAAVALGSCWSAAFASAQPANVTIAILPSGLEPEELEDSGFSPGELSAGLSSVDPAQTYLDISQGNRLFTSLYDGDLPIIGPYSDRVPHWNEIVERADGAPASVVPGLLASTLRGTTIPVHADPALSLAALIAVNQQGLVDRTAPQQCVTRICHGFTVVPGTVDTLPELARRLLPLDLLIALERPPPPDQGTLTIGIAGSGFDGKLTSDTTRTEGFVTATDIAPTVLERFGLGIPDEMNGEPIRAEGERDAASVQDRADRLQLVASRRSPVIIDNLLIWLGLALAAALASPGRWSRPALAVLGLSVVYLPMLLLAGAALEPSLLGERLVVGVGAPLLAALTLAVAPGWWALAVACGATVGAHGVDVFAGSPLSARSLLGPNPALGVRFFGIGNELESALSVLVPAGVGAALTAITAARRAPPRAHAAAAFLIAGGLAAALFAAGRFGADVGAAIVLPAGAAAAALAVPGVLVAGARRRWLLVPAAAVGGLALLAAIDLVLGGDAHLSRSVLDAGGGDDLADVAERRLRLSARSYVAASDRALFWVAVAILVAAIALRRRIAGWLEDAPLARAGLIGAAASVGVGMLANDSGSIFLIVGSFALAACLAFAWAQKHADIRTE
jgi:hypothetical protein